MVIKVYVSDLSGSFEVKKHQQRICTLLESKSVDYITIDVTSAEQLEAARAILESSARARPGDPTPLPPQIYNEEAYCGDFSDFDYANETGQLLVFLRLREGQLVLQKPLTGSGETPPASETSESAPLTGQNGLHLVEDAVPLDVERPSQDEEREVRASPQPALEGVQASTGSREEGVTPTPQQPAHEVDSGRADCLDADQEVRLSQYNLHERFSTRRSLTGGVQSLRYT